jgi:hypothetical protein
MSAVILFASPFFSQRYSDSSPTLVCTVLDGAERAVLERSKAVAVSAVPAEALA